VGKIIKVTIKILLSKLPVKNRSLLFILFFSQIFLLFNLVQAQETIDFGKTKNKLAILEAQERFFRYQYKLIK
jgi:hypothetical protein